MFSALSIGCEDADRNVNCLVVFTLGLSCCIMHVSLVQVDVIVGPLQGAEFQYLVLGNMGSLLRAFSGLFAVCGRLHVAEHFTTALCGLLPTPLRFIALHVSSARSRLACRPGAYAARLSSRFAGKPRHPRRRGLYAALRPSDDYASSRGDATRLH